MRLARRALVAALATLTLLCAASAQTLRPGNDPRNQAPTVGTGGSPGGPTGLFTIYDGDTLRKGEYTFSIAFSNYDRDPGNVDFQEIPVSFQLGLGDHVEVFFNTDAYRGVKPNNPQNLSSFYLPNSQLFRQPFRLCVPQAIILAPIRVSGTGLGPSQTLFRPDGPPCGVGGQAFTPFPFVGATGPNFGVTGPPTSAVPLVTRLGANASSAGTFDGAATFPGIGSPFGSILPGVVLTTRVIPPNLTFNQLTVPDLFTVAPAYLPDAPFINRLYGESSFNTFTFGANILLTEVDNPLKVTLIPMYRFYSDKPDDAQGFNQLQRGASPGGDIGDFGLFAALGGRLSRSVHMAVNFGYFLNSNPRSEAFGVGKVNLLDRPDEFISGVGFDFPVNRYFQGIAELKSVRYVGGRTPNAFPNNPIDVLLGARVFPRRWMSFGGWYRAHMNQQGDRLFNERADQFPVGFEPSEDPHGFGFQFTVGRRNERLPTVFPNQPPTATLTASTSRVVLAADCPPGQQPNPGCTPTASTVQLSTQATDPDGDTLLYTYSTTGGRITGDGPNATLDLTGVQAGTYTVSVEVDDGCGCVAFTSTTVTVERCDCVPIPTPTPCPTVTVSCPDTATPGQPVTFTANVSGGDPNVTPTYNWTVSAGTISSGQGTATITVDTTGVTGPVTATVDVGGYDRSCSTSASCTTSLPPQPAARKIDEYGNIRFNDEKARLDNFAIELQNDPTANAAIITYGGRTSRPGEAERRYNRARNYLVNQRGISEGRILPFIDGGFKEEPTTELWIVPSGATPPAASPSVDPSEVRPARAPRRRRRGRRDDEE